jgi:hypothetical protein
MLLLLLLLLLLPAAVGTGRKKGQFSPLNYQQHHFLYVSMYAVQHH